MKERSKPNKRVLPDNQVTLLELLAWMGLFAGIFATHSWFGEQFLVFCFYGVLGGLTWRVSKFIPLPLAILICGIIATVFTILMFPFAFG